MIKLGTEKQWLMWMSNISPLLLIKCYFHQLRVCQNFRVLNQNSQIFSHP